MSGWWSRLREELAARPFWGTGSTPHIFLRCQEGTGDTAFPGSGEPSLCVVTRALAEPCPLKDPPPAGLGPPAWGCSVGSRVYCALSPPRVLAEAPCPRPPPRRLKPGLDTGMLVLVSGSLSGDPVCGPARPPLARPQVAALPRSGLLLHKMLSSGSLRRAVPLLGLQTKRWTLVETAVDRKTPPAQGNLQERPGVRMFMGNLEVPPCPDSPDQPGTWVGAEFQLECSPRAPLHTPRPRKFPDWRSPPLVD